MTWAPGQDMILVMSRSIAQGSAAGLATLGLGAILRSVLACCVDSERLRRFEGHGKARNCNVFYLTTLSFQAPTFYR